MENNSKFDIRNNIKSFIKNKEEDLNKKILKDLKLILFALIRYN